MTVVIVQERHPVLWSVTDDCGDCAGQLLMTVVIAGQLLMTVVTAGQLLMTVVTVQVNY